jgi:rod shape-determining protein MreC
MRRRLVVGFLCVLSLALVTVYFRESDGGVLHGLQSTGASVLRPFEVAADRVASPFEDGASWFGGLLHAKSDNKKLRKEVDELRAQQIVNLAALRENAQLKQQLKYLESPKYPEDYRPVVARVIARAPSQFSHQIVVSAGKNQGISKHDAVVTAEGLVGLVTKVASNVAQVTLLTDDSSAVSVVDIKTNASGIAQQGISDSLTVDQVTKDQIVRRGDILVTAGWRSGDLSSLYPRGIQVCQVTQVGQSDTDLYKQIQCNPFVDFSGLEAVIVLVRKAESK